MSRKGNCWDNAVAESFFHSLKTELIYAERYSTRKIAKQSVFEYIEAYYNRVRQHSAIGSIAPEMFENQWKKAHRRVYKFGARSQCFRQHTT